MVSELFFAKFLEILMTGSLEISKFLQKQSVSISQAITRALHLTQDPLGNKQKLRIAEFVTLFPFELIIVSNKRLKPSIHCIQIIKIAQIVRVLSK